MHRRRAAYTNTYSFNGGFYVPSTIDPADNIVIEGMTNVTIKVGGSSIAIAADGIALKTDGLVKIEAGTTLDAKSTAALTIQSSATADIKSSAPMTIKSDATAEIKSSATTVKGDGTLTLKGGVVMIN